MSQDYETKRPDLRASRDEPGSGQSAAEDPLVELARIVHKNKQSGADVSSGRVGSTDYFAGLDDFAGSSESSDTSPARQEPTFAPTPGASFGSGQADQHAEPVTAAPDASAGTAQAQSLDALTRAFEPTETVVEDRSSHVSALWPDMPGKDAPVDTAPSVSTSYTSPQPAEPRPVPPSEPVREPQGRFEPVAANDRSSLAPTLSVDLEQNLTAELEDELIGALRHSVDETRPFAGQPETESAPDLPEPTAPQPDPFAYTGASLDTGKPAASAPAFGEGFHFDPQPAAPAVQDAEVAPVVSAPSVAAPTGFDKPVSTAPVHGEDLSLDIPVTPPEPAPGQRPRIDEDDLFAALNPDHAAVSAPDQRDAGSAGEPAGIDALFADLDFPPPGDRKSAAPVNPEPVVEVPPAQPVAAEPGVPDIDDMTWPAAAASVPQADEDETPPPPEGYDLDAVARAMQESDPSLTGAGVLPPHSPAEREAVPQAREKSRRGLVVAAGILGVAVLGGAGFFLLDSDSVVVPSGPPPVISGLQEPLKIYPDQAQAPVDDQSAKLIYDRVDDNNVSGPDRLVLPETPQPAELPPAPAGTSGSADLVPGAPKRVRTVIVRPDGTFVSDDDQAAAAAPAPATPQNEPSAPAAGETSGSRVVATTPIAPAASDVAPATPAETPAPASPETPAIVSDAPGTDTTPVVSEPAAPVPSVLPRKKPAAPVRVASAPPATTSPAPAAQNDGPLNLTQQPSAPVAPAAPAATQTSGSIAPGTYIVQVTSQRSAAAASEAYSGLQRRYPSVLGNRNAVIVSANVQDRGVFYRARIPTTSREEAISLCESLQAAGGDCFVRRQP